MLFFLNIEYISFIITVILLPVHFIVSSFNSFICFLAVYNYILVFHKFLLASHEVKFVFYVVLVDTL